MPKSPIRSPLRNSFRLALILGAAAALAASAREARAESQYVIVSGSGGTPEFDKRFTDWTGRLVRALRDKMGVAPDRIRTLVSTADVPTTATAASLDSIHQALTAAGERINPERGDLTLVLIGHGSYLRRETKFQIPGPDLSAAQLAGWLGEAKARRTILVNATSASAGFVNALSGPDRIICSATKSVEEHNATRFMEGLLKAMEENSADMNRDERVSVLELCRQGAALTDAAYREAGLIATEHAILDDNGDGLGSRLADLAGAPTGGSEAGAELDKRLDGALAAATFVRDFNFPASVPKELVERYLAALDKVEGLKTSKAGMKEDEFYAELEPLLLDAARANREIREIMAKEPTKAAAKESSPGIVNEQPKEAPKQAANGGATDAPASPANDPQILQRIRRKRRRTPDPKTPNPK